MTASVAPTTSSDFPQSRRRIGMVTASRGSSNFTVTCTDGVLPLQADGVVLDHRVRQQSIGQRLDLREVGFAVDVDLEALALAHAGHAGDAEARERRQDRAPLRI